MFARLSLAHQFLLVSLAILLTGMFVIGTWVGEEIENGVINRTGAITALYVDSFVSPHLQDVARTHELGPEHPSGIVRGPAFEGEADIILISF